MFKSLENNIKSVCLFANVLFLFKDRGTLLSTSWEQCSQSHTNNQSRFFLNSSKIEINRHKVNFKLFLNASIDSGRQTIQTYHN